MPHDSDVTDVEYERYKNWDFGGAKPNQSHHTQATGSQTSL